MQIQQALFGYDGGHQLIAASTRLPTEAKHDLAVATDLSGSPPLSGFSYSYTGLAVPGTEFYAVFCTWLAPEMPRPGCVWSHVLLIELADLAQIPDLGELRSLFRRPIGNHEATWRNPITFRPKQAVAASVSRCRENDCGLLVRSLYGSPESPAVVEAASGELLEDLVFAVWSQQWPKLRRSFRFSTGSFADRGRTGQAFDLQITPGTNRSSWQERPELSREAVRDDTARHAIELEDAWVRVTIEDLMEPDRSGFRSFLQLHALEADNPRAVFARFGAAFDFLVARPVENYSDRLGLLALMFPHPTEAVRLKEWLVSIPLEASGEADVETAWRVVFFLATAPQAAAYANVTFDHGRLAPVLWQKCRDRVVVLLGDLVRQRESSAATSFARAVANALSPADLSWIAEARPELVPVMVGHRSTLAFAVATWRLPAHIQSQIFDVLDRLSLTQEVWSQVLGAMFVAATGVSVRQVVEKAGPLAMEGALRWLHEGESIRLLPSEGWRDALALPAEDMLCAGDNLEPGSLALCAWCVSSGCAKRVLSASRTDIRNLVTQGLERIPEPLRMPTGFLILALGLLSRDISGLPLITCSFFGVHEALKHGNYSTESWQMLAPELPYLGWWRDWDRCEKLRLAVRDWFRRHSGSEDILLDAADSSERRMLVREVFTDEGPTREFLD